LIGEAELGRTVLVERHERTPDALLVVQRERGLIAVDVYAHHLLAEMVVERKFGITLFHSKLGAQCAVGVKEGKRPAAAFRGRAEQERRFAALVGEGEDRGSIGQDAELRAGRAVCVVEIEIRGLPYRLIGVEAVKGTVFGIPQDNFIVIPLKTYELDFGPLIRQRSLYFTATSKTDETFNDAVEEARYLMRARRKLGPNEKDNFGIVTPDAITGLRDRIFGTVFIVAIAVPFIALVVGAIVIMNIMLVSVTERTKEIGLRKSLGARKTDILKQFLFEAVTMATIGGAVGIFLAWVVGKVVTATFFPTYLSIFAILGALAASGGMGIISGIVPAWKAARLDPIEALRADT